MTAKTTNRYLLFTIIVGLIGFTGFYDMIGIQNTDLQTLVGYLIMLATAAFVIKKSGAHFTDTLPFQKGLKKETALWIVVLTFCAMPLLTCLSHLGTMGFGDISSVVKGDLFSGSYITMLLGTAVMPALFEEMLFRNFFFVSYKEAKGIRFAVYLSAILFGLFHGNGCQMIYATVLGIAYGLIREMTGSFWSTVLAHFVNNGWSVTEFCLGRAYPDFLPLKANPTQYMGFESAGQIAFTLAITAVSIVLIVLILKKIAKIEGREDVLVEFVKGPSKEKKEIIRAAKQRVFTASMNLSLVYYVGFLALMTVGLKVMESGAISL